MIRARALSWRTSSAYEDEAAGRRAVRPDDVPRFLPPVPLETSLVLKYLVDYVLKHKLHKGGLFVLAGKAHERKSLLRTVRRGELPARLSSYSSYSICAIVRELLETSFAPLVPYDRFATLTALVSSSRQPRDWRVACSVLNALAPERRGLLESILLVLYKLGLRDETGSLPSPSSSSRSLGTILARPSEHDELLETMALREQIGVFLIEHAPELLRCDDKVHDSVRAQENNSASEAVSSSDSHSGRSRSPAADAESSRSQTRHSLAGHSVAQRGDASPAHRLSRIGTAMLSSAKTAVLRLSSPTRSALASPAPKETGSPSITLESTASKPLNPADAAVLKRVLTAIVASPQSKRGLFVQTSNQEGEVRVVEHLLQGARGSDSLHFLPLESFSALTLALFVQRFLTSRGECLLGRDALARAAATSTAADSEAVEDAESRATWRSGSLSRRETMQSMIESLDETRRELLVIALDCMKSALDAGTDPHKLNEALAPCILGDYGRAGSVGDTTVLEEIWRLFRPSPAPRGDQVVAAHEQQAERVDSIARHAPISAVLAVYWATKCRLRARNKHLGAIKSQSPTSARRRPMSDAVAVRLCSLLEHLVTTATHGDRSRTSELLAGLFVSSSVDFIQQTDDFTLAVCDQLVHYDDAVDWASFSLQQLTHALQLAMTREFEPLVPFALLHHHHHAVDSGTTTSAQETADTHSLLNIWRFEAFVLRELSFAKREVVRALFACLELAASPAAAAPETASDSVYQTRGPAAAASRPQRSRVPVGLLHEAVGAMLFHPGDAFRQVAGDFCARIRQARLFVTAPQGKQRIPRSLATSRDSVLSRPVVLSSSELSPSLSPQDTVAGDSASLDSVMANDDWVSGVDLTLPPASLAEFLVRSYDRQCVCDTV